MAETNATPGSTFTGPIEIKAADGLVAFGALPATMDDQTGGTADTTDFTISDVTVTPTQTLINNNFATVIALIDRILKRIQ